jgi:hypothetical protein
MFFMSFDFLKTGTEQWNVEGSKSKTSKSKTQGKEEGQGSINEETSLSGLQKYALCKAL